MSNILTMERGADGTFVLAARQASPEEIKIKFDIDRYDQVERARNKIDALIYAAVFQAGGLW